ncbi:MAG TPA: Uma2 family endonuclease [Acidimicrobiales bacterium]|nr:Uma2 family endonuclease [Acidimicrobiales bacterium]
MAVAWRTTPPLTVDDLDHFPSDGCRYELIEGDLHVSAAPRNLHQRALQNLLVLLARTCPPELEILPGPAVVLGPATQLEPDFCVVPVPAGHTPRKVEAPPLLVCEILSPSTRRYDLGMKRPVYRDAGVGAMWIVDPEIPSVTEWRWDGEDEVERHAEGEEPLDVAWPFPVRVVPARLVEPGGTAERG